MISQHRTQQAIALFISDLVAIALAFGLAYWLRFTLEYPVPVVDRPEDVPTLVTYARYVLLPSIFVLPLALAAAGLYRIRRVYARVETYIHLAAALSFGILAVAAIVQLVFRPERFVPDRR